MTNMLKKVFNWSKVHLSEMTCYKIHTLDSFVSKVRASNLTFELQILFYLLEFYFTDFL